MEAQSIQSTPFGGGKPWYQRPHSADAPTGFSLRLSEAEATLADAAAQLPCVLASSLSAEDMVLLHLIQTLQLPITTFALDTGKLPAATLELWDTAEQHYHTQIERVIPSAQRLQHLNTTQDDSAIYESKAARELCCTVRKTEPLRQQLQGKAAWVTGLRRAQSTGRAEVPLGSWDASFGLHKFNPLANWSDEDLWYFIDHAQVPVSCLYDKGYASIGCDPCTRPIRFDEHPRAGRWWWEQTTASECGIHVAAPAHSSSAPSSPAVKP